MALALPGRYTGFLGALVPLLLVLGEEVWCSTRRDYYTSRGKICLQLVKWRLQ